MNKEKQLAINMIAQIVAFITNLLIGFFLTPYIVEHVGEEAYGFVGLANSFISYATIVTVALNSMASRFITISIHQEKYDDTNKYFTSVIFSNIIIAIPLTIISVFILIYLDKLVEVPHQILPDVTLLWALLFANFIISLIGNVFNVATFAKNRLELSSLRSLESNFLKLAVLLCAFVFFKPSVWYLGLSTLLCGIYVIIANLYYTKKLLPFVEIDKKYIDIKKIKQLLSSGVWNSLTKISGILSTGLDLLISNIFVGPSAMGLVSISKTLHVHILSAFSVLSGVFMPQLTISYAKGDYKYLKNQLLMSIRLLGFFACIPVACIFVYGEMFYQLWMPQQDAKLLQTLTIMGTMAFPLSLSLEPIWNIFTVTNKVKQSSIALMVSAIISVMGTFVLLSFVDDETLKLCIITGFSTLIGLIRTAVFLPIYGAKCVNFKWFTFYPTMLKIVISVIITIVLSVIIKNIIGIQSWVGLFFAVILTATVACFINYFVMLKKEEREFLKGKILKGRRQK